MRRLKSLAETYPRKRVNSTLGSHAKASIQALMVGTPCLRWVISVAGCTEGISNMRKRYLVCHDYGQGGSWAYVNADSPEEITREFDVEVVSSPPPWLSVEAQSRLKTYDVDSPGGWLAMVRKR